MESLENQYKTQQNGNRPFLYNLLDVFTNLGIDSEKLLKHFQPKIYKKFEEIEDKISKYYDDDKKKIALEIITSYKKIYLLQNITHYRNAVVHTGNIEINDGDPNKIVKSIFNHLSKIINLPNINFLNEKNEILNEVYDNYLSGQFTGLNNGRYSNKIMQELIMKEIIEIILLILLGVDCNLNKTNHFNENEAPITKNTKEYLSEFIISKN